MKKMLLMGLGEVGTSLLNLIIKENIFDISDIFILDKDYSVLNKFKDFGGNEENFINMFVEKNNYQNVLNYISEDDLLIDLVNGIDNYLMAKECVMKGVHYISSCDDCFDEKFNCFTFDEHFKMYKELKQYKEKRATSLLQFGMNPGMVNVFSKKALIDVVKYDKGEYVTNNKEYLESLIREKKYNELAKELKVTAFVETDNDTTITNIKEDENTIYSTWNVPDYNIEINENSIVKLGTLYNIKDTCSVFNINPNEELYYYNKNSGTLIFDKTAINIKANVYSPIGMFTGTLVSHEEAFSIHDYYSVKDEEGNILYAPSFCFIYKPCDLALKSIEKHVNNTEKRLIKKEDMISGGEAVGVIIMGENFSPRYVGNYLDKKDTGFETPTIMQVSISLLAAVKYIINHPNEGIMFPEETEIEEIIEYALPYMKKIESVEIFV